MPLGSAIQGVVLVVNGHQVISSMLIGSSVSSVLSSLGSFLVELVWLDCCC